MLLVMTVNPGFGGQTFIDSTLRKINQAAEWRTKQQADFLIEVDGGITPTTAPHVIAAGANVLVAGNAIFNTDNRAEAIASIRGTYS
jgi:ribulose-phosphate 3-epimerase